MRTLSLTVLLCVFWLVTSGRLEPLLVGFMAVACALVVLLSRRLGTVDAEGHPIHLVPRALRFWAWLLVRVVRSNLEVLGILLRPRLRVAPRIVRVPIVQRTDLGRAILANCVTLTPGTVSLEVHDDHLVVHALTDASAEDVLTGEMDRRVAAVVDPRGTSAAGVPGPGGNGPEARA